MHPGSLIYIFIILYKMSKYSNVSVKQLVHPGGIDDALKVRIAVFVDEQKYTLESELDE